jgi:hypothetical protein
VKKLKTKFHNLTSFFATKPVVKGKVWSISSPLPFFTTTKQWFTFAKKEQPSRFGFGYFALSWLFY